MFLGVRVHPRRKILRSGMEMLPLFSGLGHLGSILGGALAVLGGSWEVLGRPEASRGITRPPSSHFV